MRRCTGLKPSRTSGRRGNEGGNGVAQIRPAQFLLNIYQHQAVAGAAPSGRVSFDKFFSCCGNHEQGRQNNLRLRMKNHPFSLLKSVVIIPFQYSFVNFSLRQLLVLIQKTTDFLTASQQAENADSVCCQSPILANISRRQEKRTAGAKRFSAAHHAPILQTKG